MLLGIVNGDSEGKLWQNSEKSKRAWFNRPLLNKYKNRKTYFSQRTRETEKSKFFGASKSDCYTSRNIYIYTQHMVMYSPSTSMNLNGISGNIPRRWTGRTHTYHLWCWSELPGTTGCQGIGEIIRTSHDSKLNYIGHFETYCRKQSNLGKAIKRCPMSFFPTSNCSCFHGV